MAVSSEKNDNETGQPVSAIGFEGFEKRLEITFSNVPMFSDPTGLGLRSLTRAQLDSFLDEAACTIVAELSNSEFDSYVLSESSLFVYPHKIILKTCGTTKLLLAIEPVLKLADSVGLSVSSVLYSRGTFIFPNAQVAPHRSFSEEVSYLNRYFGNLGSGPHAYVLGDPTVQNCNWHVYSASCVADVDDRRAVVTVEMCMTGLNREKAAVFYKKEGHLAKEMTKMSKINDIISSHEICDVDFDPCGYSMNGVDGGAYSTVHVTPEDGFSYASYEVMGFDSGSVRFEPLVQRALRCFEPKEFTIAITCLGGVVARDWVNQKRVDVKGFTCRSAVKQELSNGGFVIYKTYVAQLPTYEVHVPKSIIALPCWKAVKVAEDGSEMVAYGRVVGRGFLDWESAIMRTASCANVIDSRQMTLVEFFYSFFFFLGFRITKAH
ncbi:S-adenosylmethionine decarboxylase proenzyme [Beta vulgaris subsp. vulgaris]|uniref:S-adenosylmethionine decarboxylase proenzyme n=1 Tax=Beta vulgaris subsp. vulgaris TaxID=3555 RepID=UPI002036C985|nr:S-adenosylmethionine decarboxylase proenzyme [Beta vulgaris subsp. vulgaris]